MERKRIEKGGGSTPHRSLQIPRHLNPDSFRPGDTRTSWERAKAVALTLLITMTLFPRQADSQSRRINSLEDFEWEEAEEDQQCEMVVKCKPAKTATPAKTTSSAPETSTYRVPLKPYGAPFNPMAEGGSVMWQKMGTTPKSKNAKKSRVAATTMATNEGRSPNNAPENAGSSFRRRKKIRKGTAVHFPHLIHY